MTPTHRSSHQSSGDKSVDRARAAMADVVAGWTFGEPLLLAAWNFHEVVANPAIESLRTGGRRIEFNPDFITGLTTTTLETLLRFEMVRVVLAHPYSRRLPDAASAYTASNLAVQESLHTELDLPAAAELLDDPEMASQSYEVYYRQLRARQADERSEEQSDERPKEPTNEPLDQQSGQQSGQQPDQQRDQQPDQQPNEQPADRPDEHSAAGPDTHGNPPEQGDAPENDADPPGRSAASNDQNGMADHFAASAAAQRTELWDDDPLTRQQIETAIARAAEQGQWGSLAMAARQRMLAGRPPQIDDFRVLRNFRRSMRGSRRRLTRMRANRRYGLDQMGSLYRTQIHLLLAIDVSGSMTDDDIQKGLAIVRRLFRRDVTQIDLLQFDSEIVGPVLPLKRRRSQFDVGGRGGTNFQSVLDYVAGKPKHDGVIIFTDGCAPPPRWPESLPSRRRPPVVWLLVDRERHDAANSLGEIGPTTYIV